MSIITRLEAGYNRNRLAQTAGSPKGSDLLRNIDENGLLGGSIILYKNLLRRINFVFGKKGLDAHARTLATIAGGTLLAIGAIGIATPLVLFGWPEKQDQEVAQALNEAQENPTLQRNDE